MISKKKYMPYVSGILVSTIFGFSFMFTRNSLDIMAPMQVLAFRFMAAALFLSCLRAFKIIKISFRGKRMAPLFALALVQPVIYFIFETYGINLTSSSEAGMMIALIPVLVTVLGAVFLKEKPSFLQGVFVLVSFSGVIFMVLSQGISGARSSLFGIISLIGAVLCAAVYNILSRKLSFHFKPVEITYVMMCAGAVFFNILVLAQELIKGRISDYYKPLLNFNSWIPILYLGILSSVAAFFMTNFMLSKLPAAQSSVFSNLTTVVSILAGVFIRGEAFLWYQAVGGTLILIGVWGTNYFSKLKTGENIMQSVTGRI